MENLIEQLIEIATKKRDRNGNPVYTMPVQTILDAGVSLADLRTNAKPNGFRFLKNDSKLTVQTHNLRFSLKNLISPTK